MCCNLFYEVLHYVSIYFLVYVFCQIYKFKLTLLLGLNTRYMIRHFTLQYFTIFC